MREDATENKDMKTEGYDQAGTGTVTITAFPII
jgi:hypothetical protein